MGNRLPQDFYKEQLLAQKNALSEKERALMLPPNLSVEQLDIPEIERQLVDRGFVRCEGGYISIGNDIGLPCSIEGMRANETPQREIYVPPFWISKFTVTNEEYEKFDKRHSRTATSRGNRTPATCMTYGKAVGYALWLNEQTGLSFSLPSEPQFVAAVAPNGWEYPYQEQGHPKRGAQNHYKAFPDEYPNGEVGAALDVDSPLVPPNPLGIYHATGNVSIFSFGHYSTVGHWGAISDGAYVVTLGGNFRLCPLGGRSVTRGILDVTGIVDTVGIRLVHPDLRTIGDK